MSETKSDRISRLIEDTVAISRATLPLLANKNENEKTLDDQGMEFLMSGVVFMYDGNVPDVEQFQQLKGIAAAAAITYRDLKPRIEVEDADADEIGMFNLCTAFLHLWRKNVDFSEGNSKH